MTGRLPKRPPTCPTCGSTSKRCKRPSGHEASAWHAAREDALALLCRCSELCLPWLERRGLVEPAGPVLEQLELFGGAR